MVGMIVTLAVCLGADPAPAEFTITVPRELDAVHVKAVYVAGDRGLDMSEGFYSDRVEGGIAEFVHNFSASSTDGSVLRVEGPRAGRWSVDAQPGDTITVEYDVRLNHGDYRWPFGIDNVAYTRNNSAFFVSRTFLVLSDAVQDSRINFVLPEGWRVATPWRPVDGNPSAFTVANQRLLIESCVIVGDFIEREVREGNTVVRLAIGQPLSPYADTLENAMRASILAYTDLFQDTPQARFLAVLNDNPAGGITDGSAYPNSVSMITPRRMEGANFVQAIYTLSHEVLHLWNGYRLRPAEQLEWFREGFTDYLTWRTLASLNLVPESALLTETRRQIVAYLNLDRTTTIAGAGEDKAGNTVFIYEGGSLVALCLDSMIREKTRNASGIGEFMRRVYARTAMQNAPYDKAALIAVASELTGDDMQHFFDRYVSGTDLLPIKECLATFGLDMDRRSNRERVTVTITPDESAKGDRAAARDAFLGRN